MSSLLPQAGVILVMQSSATTNGNGVAQDILGYNGALQVEILETTGGTATVALQGSNDESNWYAVGYQQVDGVTSPTRSVAAISVTANSAHVYQVLDPYCSLRAVISGIAGGATITARVYAVPA